jgi:hypothetical protein
VAGDQTSQPKTTTKRKQKIFNEFKKSSSCSMHGGGHAARRLGHVTSIHGTHGRWSGAYTRDFPLLLGLIRSVRAWCILPRSGNQAIGAFGRERRRRRSRRACRGQRAAWWHGRLKNCGGTAEWSATRWCGSGMGGLLSSVQQLASL